MLLVCAGGGVNVCVCSPERASPHLRSSAHCSVCPETHMQIWHGSANNLHEFVYYGFMSSNLNLSSKKDSCVDERVLKCARGFRRGGRVVAGLAFGYMPVPGFTCIHIKSVWVWVYIFACMIVHVRAVQVYVFQWGDPLGGTVLRAGLRSGSAQMRSCFLWTDLLHHWFRLKSCMTKWCIPNLFWTATQKKQP